MKKVNTSKTIKTGKVLEALEKSKILLKKKKKDKVSDKINLENIAEELAKRKAAESR